MAQLLKHDIEGFLVGDSVPIDSLKTEWQDIKKDTSAIRRAVNDIVKELKGTDNKTPSLERIENEVVKKPVIAQPRIEKERETIQVSKPRSEVSNRQTVSNKPEREAIKTANNTALPNIEVNVSTPTISTQETASRVIGAAISRPRQERTAAPTRQSRPRQTTRVAAPTLRGRGRNRPERNTEKVVTNNQVTNQVVKDKETTDAVKELTSEVKKQRLSSTPTRDSKGRFIGKNGSSEDEQDASERLLDNIDDKLDKVGNAVSTISDGMGETDPVIQGMTEAVAPLKTGWDLISGGSSKEEGWLRKILRFMTSWRKEDSTYNKSVKKQLKDLNEKPNGESGGGFFSNLLGFFTGKGKGGFGAIIPLLTKFGKLGGRIPIIGGLLASIEDIFEIFSSENSNDDRATKDKRTGKAAGSIAGIFAGGFAGAKIGAIAGSVLGPVGTAIGAGIGSIAGMFFGSKAGKIVGEKIGGFVTWMRGLDPIGTITKAWDNLTTSIKDTWKTVTDKFSEKWEKITGSFKEIWQTVTDKFDEKFGDFVKDIQEKWDKFIEPIRKLFDAAFEGINNFIKKWTGIDLKEKIQEVKEKAAETYENAKNKIVETKNKAVNFVSGAWDKTKNFFGGFFGGGNSEVPQYSGGDDYGLGYISRKHESSGSVGAIGTMSTDGKAYGLHQLSLKQGTLRDYLKQSKYGKEFEGLELGSAAFDAKWKEIAKRDKEGFGRDQVDYIAKTHYKPLLNKVQKDYGMDLSGRGRAVQELLFSTSTAMGQEIGGNVVGKALRGKDLNQLSDTDIIQLVQQYKRDNIETLYSKSKPEERAGIFRRTIEEEGELKALAQQEAAQNTQLAAAPTTQEPIKAPETPAQATTTEVAANNPPQPIAAKVMETVAMAQPAAAAASVPTPPQITAPTVPKTENTAPVETPLNTGNKAGGAVTVNIDGDARQDVRDRLIAHVATGGIALMGGD